MDIARELRLTVLPGNAGAIGLYESLGFVDGGVTADFFGRGADRLVMIRRRR